jgi:hypothetical protein
MAAYLISSYYPEASPAVYIPIFTSSNSLCVRVTDLRDAMLASWDVDRIVWVEGTGSLPLGNLAASFS